jgi:NRAMP (natural resistance-associated macrophage protein)-like metal ion transporter
MANKTTKPAAKVSSDALGAIERAAGVPFKKAGDYWKRLGPGLTTGASDDDPSGVIAYSQAGAKFGYQFLWLSWLTFPLMSVVQEMCARIGIATGRGLAANIRRHFPRWALIFVTLLLFIANTLNIGADLGAMASASQLIWPNFPFGAFVGIFALVSLFLEIAMPYSTYARYLKWLALVLLAYVLTAFVVPSINWGELLTATFKPTMSFTKEHLLLLTGVLGTTISPYLFFWQTSQEVEQEVLSGQTSIKERQRQASVAEVKDMRTDVWSGMLLSNLVMFFIIAVCAAVLNQAGITNINTAADAASALKPLAGDKAYLLYIVGIMGTGFLAIPVLAGSAAYGFSEMMGWKTGLYRKAREAAAFYGVIAVSTLVGLGLNFVGIDPIKALLGAAVANGLVAPVVLVFIVWLASSKEVMGKWRNRKFTTIIGWGVVTLMALSAVGAIWASF